MNRTRIFLCLLALTAIFGLQIVGTGAKASIANNTAQALPFAQNWSNTNLITANDDWSMVPGIVGYLGDIAPTSNTNVDPRTLLADYSTVSAIDVIANQSNPNTQTAGGVAEFDGIADPVVALQGSGTADAPHIVIYLNTTGQSNIRVSYNARDIDGSADNAVQQINTQYRVGNTGNFINLPGGYIADATTGPSEATLVTPVAVTLPAAANNKPLVEIRIMTTNAAGSDEWVGIDDISVTASATPAPSTANVDFNGDGRSDWVVTRNAPANLSEGGASPIMWYINPNGTNELMAGQFGLSTDIRVPEDYDGDGKDDIAVWRSGPPTQAVFYILQSGTMTLKTEFFGQTGDDPRVVNDYDGDGKADVAVYRKSAAGQNYFYYKGTLNNSAGITTFVPWGATSFVIPNVGDYDGDGKGDFCVYDQTGIFNLLRSSDFGVEYIKWGIGNESLVPGDFDADGRDDFCVVRSEMGQHVWYILERDGGGTGAAGIAWGISGANGDILTPGDYDGDGRQDVAVWRPGTDANANTFYVRRSGDGALQAFKWGAQGDSPEASWYVHRGGEF